MAMSGTAKGVVFFLARKSLKKLSGSHKTRHD